VGGEKTPEEIQQENFEHFLDHGPGLSAGYGIYVIAKCTSKKKVLLGGLGGMGMGSMWFDTASHHHQYPGWDKAPEQDAP